MRTLLPLRKLPIVYETEIVRRALRVRIIVLLLQVDLVANQDNAHFVVCVFAHFLKPLDQVFERSPLRYVVHEQRTDRATVVAARD